MIERGVLLDTNVLSELSKSRPDPNVVRFFQNVDPQQAYISVLSLGELRKGIVQRAKRDVLAANRLEAWTEELEVHYRQRTLQINIFISRLWGEYSAGRTRPIVDTLLAATAKHHDLTLATRNVKDVADLPVRLHNPWLP